MSSERARIITAKVPKRLVEEVDKLVDDGRYATRSDAIRAALRLLVMKEREIGRVYGGR